MKRFLITLGSLTIIASVAFVIIRMLSKKTGEGGDDFGETEEDEEGAGIEAWLDDDIDH